MEAKVLDIVQLHNLEGEKVARVLVLGQVVGIYVDDRFVVDGIIQIAQMRPIARLGYQDYAVVDEVFSLVRPAGGGNLAGGG
jgi:flavin reductase (DIM6/NTAB) family NADH-FMN oxidoreductase RutF